MVNIFRQALYLRVRPEPTWRPYLQILDSTEENCFGLTLIFYVRIKSFIRLTLNPNVIKLLRTFIYKFSLKKLERLSIARLSSLVLHLWVIPGAYPIVEHQGKFQPLLQTLSGLPGSNTFAYYEHL